jgi:hypothetical protein
LNLKLSEEKISKKILEKNEIFFSQKVYIQVFGFREVFSKKHHILIWIFGDHLKVKYYLNQGILTVGRISTVDLLIKSACFVKEVNNIFDIKRADLN